LREIRSSNEPAVKISRQQAVEITRKFLEQHHNVSNAKTVWKQDRWVVTMCVGISKSDIRHVEIDAVTGRILGYT
jgi:hypothetical protein